MKKMKISITRKNAKLRHLFKLSSCTSLLFSVLFLSSCQKEEKETNQELKNSQNSSIPVSDGSTYKATVLGPKLKNPFQIDTMRKAFKFLTGEQCNLPITHRYVRFLPSNQSEYDSLKKDKEMELYEIPFDHQILELGDYYQSPGIPIEQITWQYTVLPISKPLPNFVTYEVLDNLFIPTEQNLNQCNTSTSVDEIERKTFEMTNNLDEYMNNELDNKTNTNSTSTTKRAVRYNPFGQINTTNTQLGTVSVRNVKVRSRRWFNISKTWTNNTGNFFINERYRGRVHIDLEFTNNNATIRGIRGARIWQIVDAVDVEVGEFRNRNMENISFTIVNSNNVTSETKRRWMSAAACNALEEYRDLATFNNIATPPSDLNIWLTTEITVNDAGSAPMLKRIANTSALNSFITFKLVQTGHVAFAAIKVILEQFPPDISYGYNTTNANNLLSDQIAELFYHEFAHASHYSQVGNNYWAIYIGYILANNGYGNINTTGSARIEISEGWADFVGHNFSHARYGLNFSIVDNYRNTIDLFQPRPISFPFNSGGTMHDMTDVMELNGAIRDEVQTYTMQEIFEALQPNIVSVPQFRDEVLMRNNFKEQLPMGVLFGDYGF